MKKPPTFRIPAIPRLRQPEPDHPPIAILDPAMRAILDATNDRLDRVDEWLKETFTEPSPFRDRKQGNADGTGNLELRFMPPMGFAWYVERFAYEASAGTPTVRVYVGSVANENIVDESSGVIRNVSDNYQPIWVPEGTALIFLVSDAAAASNFGLSLQGKVVRA